MQLNIRIMIYLCLLLILIPSQVLFAAENKPSFINSFEEDLTGDGFHEYAKIQGNLLRDDSHFYQSVWMDITSEFKKEWSISLHNGYNPQIKLIDLNHDQVFDIYYQIAKNEQNQHFHYQFYTLKDGTVMQLPLPKHLYSNAAYQDNFQVQIQINPNDVPVVIDVSPRKTTYIKEQLYDDKGKLLDKSRVTIEPISIMEPVLISESKGYGLKSIQQVHGLEGKDPLGQIETLWYFKKDEWIILKNQFQQTE